jgi:ANTAR domain-containing protein
MTGKRARRRGSGQDAAAAGLAATDCAAVEAELESELVSSANPAFDADDAVVRRTKDGWRVGGDELPDLTCAMILADLIAAENGMTDAPDGKPSMLPVTSETGKLRATVSQLEHALLTRIRVEQAIGVLAERHRIKPRQAFEQLREAARSRGRRVIDIAGDVVARATNPLLQLPDELSRPRAVPRRGGRQQPSGAQ